MRQATPLWRKSFLSQLQEEQQQAIAQQSSQHETVHRPHPHASAALVQSTGGHIHTQSNNQHQRKVQSAIKASKSKVNSSRNENVNTWTDSGAVSGDSSIEQSRALSAKLKGRLGHLVAAIAEAHSSNSSISSVDRYSNGAYNSKSGGRSHDVVRVHSNAWMPADDDSLDCIEVHTCSKCDKMYNNREALEHHQSVCTL